MINKTKDNASATRTVTAFSSGQNIKKVSIETSSSTWTQLKQELQNAGVMTDGMSAISRADKKNLNGDSVLPEGDIMIYLMPEKTNSGKNETVISKTVKTLS